MLAILKLKENGRTEKGGVSSSNFVCRKVTEVKRMIKLTVTPREMYDCLKEKIYNWVHPIWICHEVITFSGFTSVFTRLASV